MNLSIAWIFDHIDANWQDQDIEHLITTFNQVTAEIEHSYHINYRLDDYFLGELKALTNNIVFIPELSREVTVTARENAAKLDYVLLKKDNNEFRWARLSDFGVDKDGLIPSLVATQEDLNGSWRKRFEHKDVIIEVDNKSITHRPDMWGHRGFAREIAAFMNLRFIPSKKLLQKHPVKTFKQKTTPTKSTPFTIENNVPETCYAFNGLYFNEIENKASDIFITSRLLKVGARPRNAIVDLTNYVTLDWSQPVHAYDADKIAGKKIIIRHAQPDEKLLLLDDNELTLTTDDMVIASAEKPMCLAGVKGGMDDSVETKTSSIFFESANFDAGSVRRAAMRHKTRTDSSARFEKTLDPAQALETVFRFLYLLEQSDVQFSCADEVISIAPEQPDLVIMFDHSFLEQRLGYPLTAQEVVDLLTPLEFEVTVLKLEKISYQIKVPSFRACKDVQIKEDILEEIARAYGFNKIPLELPRLHRTPFDLTPINRLRNIRQSLANDAGMMEQQNYSFFNEQLTQEFGIEVGKTVEIVNPVSENYYRLVTSLIPALCKNVKDNSVHHDTINFFECGRIWSVDNNKSSEQQSIAGIFFNKRGGYNFYDGKQVVNNLFTLLGFNTIEWQQITEPTQPWYKPYQSATLVCDDKIIGTAGNIDPRFLTKLAILPESDGFIFELDGDFLRSAPIAQKKYQATSRFQESFFDLSILVPLNLTVHTVFEVIQHVSDLVYKVELIDFFEHEKWLDQRSLTFRLWMNHHERTLEKDEIDGIRADALTALEGIGAILRS